MTKVIPLYDEDNETQNTLMIYTGQCQYYNQIIIQKSEFENTYQFQIILNDKFYYTCILKALEVVYVYIMLAKFFLK